jgi:hypothetical protein
MSDDTVAFFLVCAVSYKSFALSPQHTSSRSRQAARNLPITTPDLQLVSHGTDLVEPPALLARPIKRLPTVDAKRSSQSTDCSLGGRAVRKSPRASKVVQLNSKLPLR